jgi:F-type H+-transporting ATPase subunit b
MSIWKNFALAAALSGALSVIAMNAAPAMAAEDHPPAAPAATAEHAEEPNLLAFSPDLAIFSAIVFLLLLGLLGKFAWPQIVAALDEREHNIANNIAAAEAKHEEAKRLLAEHETKLAATAGEIRAMLEEARREAEVAKGQIVADAKHAAQDEANRAKRDIDQAKNTALQELAVTSANLAVDLARKVVQEQITPDRQARLVQEAIGKLASAGASKN